MERADLRSIPTSPGVYLFLNQDETVLYVGKAKNLKARVNNYFNAQDSKTQELILHAKDIQTIATRNEVEALLLENRLIKQHKPPYNIMLKDAERYAWICVTQEDFPRLLTVRNTKRKGTYFGPYTDGTARRKTVVTLNKIFKLRTCTRLPKKVCLQYHIKNCSGPCQGFDSKESYQARIQQAMNVLKGNIAPVQAEIRSQMNAASAQQRFEEAKDARDALQALEFIHTSQIVDRSVSYDQDIIGRFDTEEETVFSVLHVSRGTISQKREYRLQHAQDLTETFLTTYYRERIPPKEIIVEQITRERAVTLQDYFSAQTGTYVRITIPQRGDKRALLELATKNATLAAQEHNPQLERLKKTLRLPTIPLVIDCFDISTLQGTHTVAASVRYRNGKPDPQGYRRYKIQGAQQDDYAAMAEVVTRRYSKEELPDLIMVDGGKGQLSAAFNALNNLSAHTPIIGLAKQNEEVFVPGRNAPLDIPQNDIGLLLLRRIRDATHRFAITYQRKKRGDAMTRSILDHIPGIGPERKKKLYDHFSTFEHIKTASKEELQKVIGERNGETIHQHLHENK